MRRWICAVALSLSACVQQTPATHLNAEAEPIELAPAAERSKPRPAVVGEVLQPGRRIELQPSPLTAIETGYQTAVPFARPPPPPLSATSVVTMAPAGTVGISQVLQVSVGFDLLGTGAPSVAAVEFIDPQGAPYYREQAALTGSAYEAHHLEFVLPVAATAIDANKMTGAWTARLLVDGQRVATQGFELTP